MWEVSVVVAEVAVSESVTVVVALSVGMRASEVEIRVPFTRNVESKVEEALTKMPAVDDVGVMALVKRSSQAAPTEAPVASVPQ